MKIASALLFTYLSKVMPDAYAYAYPDDKDTNYQPRHQCTTQESNEHPHMCHLMDLAATNPVATSEAMQKWSQEVGLMMEASSSSSTIPTRVEKNHLRASSAITTTSRKTASKEFIYPTVLAHGMGDSCFNDGMKSITQKVSDLTNQQYSTCIPTADNLHDDVMNSYFLNMDASVDIFAAKVRSDDNLVHGFNAVGFSQGNNVIRGYIARYNDPPVRAFISVNGVNAGIGALPYCIPKNGDEVGEGAKERTFADVDEDAVETLVDEEDVSTQGATVTAGKICNALMEAASHKAYTDFSQQHSFQANYWRDPRPEQQENYQTYSQLARWNNEVLPGHDTNRTLNENWAKTDRFVWVLATQDSIVYPREGEQWGVPDPNDPFERTLPMEEAEWYVKDLFGLKTADEAGKNKFEEFEGEHLQFELSDFERWVTTYLD